LFFGLQQKKKTKKNFSPIVPSFHPPPSPKESVSGVRIYRELFGLSGENGVSAKP
jgi:hypothetical protein